MTALLRYQGALLLRSQRWIAPVLLYAAVLVVGIRPGDPVTGSFGIAAGGLLPVTAWLVRIALTGEPDAARHVTAAAAGPVRVHAAALLTGLAAAVLAGAAGSGYVLLTGAGPEPGAGPAGALAVLVCALTGTAVGAVCNRPLLRSPGYAVTGAALGVLLALVVPGSPVHAVLSALVTGARTGAVELSPAAPAGAVLLLVVAGAGSCALAARRG
ncbi:ABC transporter [Streptomyces sp. WAC06614]|uniref:ABC transporter n=1 Tax=Streptomyces sp. WAC06614 TaxID=2487416 RepID=UPI000F789061|nr:ABC transporter [Streptomyces sp. WAC06614]RSS80599.1 ABC transporter [Streptomyces sp. WAC06614]